MTNDELKLVVEAVFKRLLPTIAALVSREVAVSLAIERFFSHNKDLVNQKQLVIAELKRLAKEHPELDSVIIINEWLEEAVRAKMGVVKMERKTRKPAFVGGRK